MSLGAPGRLYNALPVFTQNLACTWAGWQRDRARFNDHFRAARQRLDRTGRSSPEHLLAIQRDRLHRLVRRARLHVPHYRALGLAPPSDARDPSEAIRNTLTSIPPLDKRTYRDDPYSFVAADIASSRLRRGKTSGTTGTALPLWYTPETLAEEYAVVWRQRGASGVEPRDPHITFNGQIVVPFDQEVAPFWRTNRYGQQTLFSIYHMRPENLGSYIDEIHRREALYVEGYPSSIHLVARAMLEENRPLPPGRVRAVFTSSETLLAFQREAIEKAFGAPVRDRYGVSEFAVSMTECAEGLLHVDMEYGIVEVEAIEENDEWVRGPLLVTALASPAVPFMRYRIGDVGTRSKRPCSCGRPGEVFLRVEGRIDDYVMTPDGRLVGRLDHVFKEQLEVSEAQILQTHRNAIDVLIVPRAGYSAVSERNLLREIRSRLGQEIGISIREVARIPREPNGKFRAVKSNVGHVSAATEAYAAEARH